MENNNNVQRDVGAPVRDLNDNRNLNDRHNNNVRNRYVGPRYAVPAQRGDRGGGPRRGNNGNVGDGSGGNRGGGPGRGGIVPPILPPGVPVPGAIAPVQLARSFMANVKAWAPKVTKGNLDLVAKFAAVGIVPILRAAVSATSKHPVSAGVRGHLVAQALGLAYQNTPANTHRICDVYGGTKLKEMAESLNNGVEDPLHVTTFRPIVVAADTARVRDCVLVPGVPADDDLLMVDVYACGQVKFDPIWLENNLGLNRRLYWVGFAHRGPAGTLFGEGAWYRTGGLIYHRPDAETPSSYSHDPCDWIWEHSVHECVDGSAIVWHVKSQVGPLCLVWFERLVNGAYVDAPQFAAEVFSFSDSLVVDFKSIPGWAKWFLQYCPISWFEGLLPTKHMIVNLEVVRRLRAAMLVRPKNLHTLRQLAVLANTEVSNSPECKLLMKIWPHQFSNLPQNCAYSAFFDQIWEDGVMLNDLLCTYGTSQAAYNSALKGFDLPYQPRHDRLLFLGVLALAAGCIGFVARRYGFTVILRAFHRIPIRVWSGSTFRDESSLLGVSILDPAFIAINVIAEEIVKSIPVLCKYFGVAEWLFKIGSAVGFGIFSGWSPQLTAQVAVGTAIAALPAWLMHKFTYNSIKRCPKPFWKRCLIHFTLIWQLGSLLLLRLVPLCPWLPDVFYLT